MTDKKAINLEDYKRLMAEHKEQAKQQEEAQKPQRVELEEAMRQTTVRLVGRPGGPMVRDDKQPILTGVCVRCELRLELPIPSEGHVKKWNAGEQISLQCPKCKQAMWSKRQIVKMASMAEMQNVTRMVLR